MKTMLPERPMNALANRHRQTAVNSRVTLINILTAALDSPMGVGCETASEAQAKRLQEALRAIRRNLPGTPYKDFNVVIPPHAPTWVWLVPTKLDGGKEEEMPDG